MQMELRMVAGATKATTRPHNKNIQFRIDLKLNDLQIRPNMKADNRLHHLSG